MQALQQSQSRMHPGTGKYETTGGTVRADPRGVCISPWPPCAGGPDAVSYRSLSPDQPSARTDSNENPVKAAPSPRPTPISHRIGEMIAQRFGFTRRLLKAWNNRVYFRLKEMSCGFKDQARARQSGEKWGLGACPRIESLLRKSPFGPFFRSLSQYMDNHMNNYSPQMIDKMDSKWLPLATASILGQAPSPESEL